MKKGISDAQKRILIKEVLKAAKEVVEHGGGAVEFGKSFQDDEE